VKIESQELNRFRGSGTGDEGRSTDHQSCRVRTSLSKGRKSRRTAIFRLFLRSIRLPELADNAKNAEEKWLDLELAAIYEILQKDAKTIVHDLKYTSRELREAGIFVSIMAALFAIAAGAITLGANAPIGFGIGLLVTALSLGGVAAKFLLDYNRITKRYQRLFELVRSID